jgi:hypothetical protein
MSTTVEVEPIPKEFLCRRCKHCGDNLRPDGLVDCSLSEQPVAPMLKKEYELFEHCPVRVGFIPLPSHKLRLLARYARRVKDRDGPEHMLVQLGCAEAVIRSDLLISTRLSR